jgi:hypothetical protein
MAATGEPAQDLDMRVYAVGLPLLTAIVVNQGNIADGELGEDALAGFTTGARRLGFSVADPVGLHHSCRDECWAWGEGQKLNDE